MRFTTCLLLLMLGTGSAQAQEQRLSPRLHQILGALETQAPGQTLNLPRSAWAGIHNLTPQGNLAAGAAEPVLTTLVVHHDLEALRRAGFDIGTTTKRVAVVRVPLSRVRELADMPDVVYVDAPGATFRMNLDVSMVETGGVDAHGGNQMPPYSGVTGKGVVVGVIDSGFDYTHEDLKDAQGDTRFLSIWDQTYAGLGKGPSPYGYGNECTAAEIDAGTCDQIDEVGHGTHVAGIAAGDGSEGGLKNPYTYVGVAPEADIIGVKFTTSRGDDAILDAASYIFDKAGMRPAVVNISLGSGLGPHDGQTALEIGLSDLTGPGRCIVAAAGNDGDVDTHAHVSVASGGKLTLDFTMGSYVPNPGSGNDVIRVDAWYQGGANMQFTLTAPNGTNKVIANPGVETFSNGASGYLYIFNTNNNPLNGDRECVMQAYDSNAGTTPPSGTWSVTIANTSGSRQTLDLWVYSDMFDNDGFNAEIGWEASIVDPTMTINSPGSADDLIATGAYVTKTVWKSKNGNSYQYTGESAPSAASFTSSGPRRDGVLKPELAAPGMGIVSAMSADAFNPVAYIVADGAHVISQGTSQASPHVAGTVALLFEKDPSLTVAEVKTALQGSAGEDANTFLYPELFGAGRLRIDAAADTITPVQLLSFTAERAERSVTLRWEIAESDALWYRVERGPAQDGPFTTMAQVDAAGSVMTWVDDAPVDRERWYRLAGMSRNGTLEVLATTLAPLREPVVTLRQNAPNPVAETTHIPFSLDAPARITLAVLDVQGRRVATLAEGLFPAGDNTVPWDGRLADGSRASAGVYFYRLTTPSGVWSKRMVVSH